MKSLIMKLLFVVLLGSAVVGQEPVSETIVVKGDGTAKEAAKLSAIWLYPEDFEGKLIKLRGFIYEPENFEYFPELNGYLFSCEPVIYGRNNSFHVHVGNATFLSQEKLNFFCSTAEGQRIRRLFKERQEEFAIPAEVVLEVQKRDNRYFGVLSTFTPSKPAE